MYLQCSKYTFLSNFTQTIYRWIYCIKKNCVADTEWVFVKVHCITLTKTCLIMPGDEGEMGKKWKTQNKTGKPWRPPSREGARFHSRLQNIRSDPGAWLSICTQKGTGMEWWSTEHSLLSPKPANRVSIWQTRAHPWGWGSGKIGRLHAMDSDELMFSSWKSPGKIHKSKSHDLQMSFTELASDFAKWATCSECQNSPSRAQVRGLKKHFIPQGSIRERLMSCAF